MHSSLTIALWFPVVSQYVQLESVQLRNHCNSKATRRRASRFGVLSAFSGFSGFFFENVVIWYALESYA